MTIDDFDEYDDFDDSDDFGVFDDYKFTAIISSEDNCSALFVNLSSSRAMKRSVKFSTK